MAEGLVERTEKARRRWDDHADGAAGCKQLDEAREDGAIVDVLDGNDLVRQLDESRGVRPDPGAHVEDAAVQPGLRTIDEPRVVCVGLRHRVEVVRSPSVILEHNRAVRVCVLTTSYPRDERDVAGSFVAAQVRGVRELGVEVDVVSPATFQDFGVAYGGGIAQNLRASPWKLALVPAFLAAFARAARTAARDADLVHAHWIPSALAAEATGKPYVLQVWGTDVELARRGTRTRAAARPPCASRDRGVDLPRGRGAASSAPARCGWSRPESRFRRRSASRPSRRTCSSRGG